MNTYGMKKRLLGLTLSAAMLAAGSVATAAADRVVELTMDLQYLSTAKLAELMHAVGRVNGQP
jgi:hypothetical protein